MTSFTYNKVLGDEQLTEKDESEPYKPIVWNKEVGDQAIRRDVGFDVCPMQEFLPENHSCAYSFYLFYFRIQVYGGNG